MSREGTDLVDEVRSSALLVLAENARLIAKLEKDSKIHEDSINFYKEKVVSLEESEATLKYKLIEVQGALDSMRAQFSVLSAEYETVRRDLEASIPFEEHEHSVGKCRELFLALKSEYSLQKLEQESLLTGLSAELKSKFSQLDQVSNENTSLKSELETLLEENRSLKACNKALEEQVHKSEKDSKEVLLSLHKLNQKTENLIREKGVHKRLLVEKSKENCNLTTALGDQCQKLGELHYKLEISQNDVAYYKTLCDQKDEEYAKRLSLIEKDTEILQQQLVSRDAHVKQLEDYIRGVNKNIRIIMDENNGPLNFVSSNEEVR